MRRNSCALMWYSRRTCGLRVRHTSSWVSHIEREHHIGMLAGTAPAVTIQVRRRLRIRHDASCSNGVPPPGTSRADA